MSLINTEVKPFKANAYHNGKFVTVTNEDLKGKWSVFVFYPADFSKEGQTAAVIHDGDDGITDTLVTVLVGRSPIYIVME